MRYLGRRFIPALLAVLTSALVCAPAVADAAAQHLNYVALGDSYAAGPLIPVQRGNPLGCLRSSQNYPSLLAQEFKVTSFTDASCSGATTDSMTAPENVVIGVNQPQFNALHQDTDLVTLTISGNDIGFASIIATCVAESLLDPFGAPCQQHYATSAGDQLALNVKETAPKVAAVLNGIHQRAPHAKVVLVGYLRILPPSAGCWPVVPIASGDVPYLDGVEQQLNAMLAAQAAANNATFVNPYSISFGHDVCQPIGRKWVEGIVPTTLAAPIHPNAAGMAAVTNLVHSQVAGVAQTP